MYKENILTNMKNIEELNKIYKTLFIRSIKILDVNISSSKEIAFWQQSSSFLTKV